MTCFNQVFNWDSGGGKALLAPLGINTSTLLLFNLCVITDFINIKTNKMQLKLVLRISLTTLKA